MTTRNVENGVGEAALPSAPFERFAGASALLTGAAGFLYAVAFIVLQSNLLSGLFLMLVGLFSTAALVAVYDRLRVADATFALFALLLGIAGALGTAVHGGYDLANAINPPPSLPDLPNQVDPRGLLTFGVAGIALFIVAWLIGRGGQFPKGLGYLAYLSAVLLVVLYLGRLIVLDATSPIILVPALLNGFLVNRGTYEGNFGEIPPTGNPVAVRAIANFRVEGGKVAETWLSADMLGMMQQIGAIPAPEQAGA